jgi:two-component system, NarL family, sensor histidine kinase LiaS
MITSLKYFPAFMKCLWCQLALSYTILTFFATMLLLVMIIGITDYSHFYETLTPDNIMQTVDNEKLIVMQAINDPENTRWKGEVVKIIREDLTNLELEHDPITNSSRPEVYIQITGRNNHLLISNPSPFPDKIATLFIAQTRPALKTTVARLKKNGPVWIDMPIMDEEEGLIGRLSILLIAKFDFFVQLQSAFDFWVEHWVYVIFLSIPIGIACGLVASRYVTRQLNKMNKVTEKWRQGNFEERIALPNDDVLIRHSQHLNDMAQDLEMYLNLKQFLAVSDERNRVARELHDTVKQKLFALGLQLATSKTKPEVMEVARENILEAETLTREAQHDLMEIITQLRPAGNGDSSLFDRIRMIAMDFMRRFDVKIELKNPEQVRCNKNAEHQVLRIVQESLMNAVRHGRASKIVIEGKTNDEITTLTIADNGTGFDINQKTEGFGLVSMRDRMNDLPNGTFEIKSTKGSGTHITVSWKNES